ncbi:MAG: hypothetical protein LBF70_00185 [Holosporales bacterium]|jgi:hypothetical protein|nr:hypothetical protein [Holosporales bacterium]
MSLELIKKACHKAFLFTVCLCLCHAVVFPQTKVDHSVIKLPDEIAREEKTTEENTKKTMEKISEGIVKKTSDMRKTSKKKHLEDRRSQKRQSLRSSLNSSSSIKTADKILTTVTEPNKKHKVTEEIKLPPLSLSSNCYIIMSNDANVVISESNSWHKVEIDSKYNNHSLSELVKLEDNYITKSYSSGITAVIQHTNDRNCKFTIAISGLNVESELFANIGKIKAWLNNFSKASICKKGTVIARIPVLYGEQEEVDVVVGDDLNIVFPKTSKNMQVKKDILYKSFVVAPVNIGTAVGNINITTGTGSYSIDLKTNSEVDRGNRIQTMTKSIEYIFWGIPK